MSTLFETATRHPAGHREVSPRQVAANAQAVRIVDVREPHEFTGDLGHIQNARLTPLPTVMAAAGQWPKDAEYVVVCRSGKRSEQAACALTAAGFPYVMNMVGGMLAWHESRLPTVRV